MWEETTGAFCPPDVRGLELPVQGAAGYASVELEVWESWPEDEAGRGARSLLPAGAPFCVLEERGNWWKIQWQDQTGWTEHRWCMINLPDVIPSIVYDAANSYQSVYRTCGKEIPGITGASFYPGKAYNRRLDREEFMMPVLYSMARKICRAQRAALEEGNTLVLYEGYRPYSTQVAVREALGRMMQEDQEVAAAVSAPPWTRNWFISDGYSDHQKGFSIDVTLAAVRQVREERCGDCPCLRVTGWELYEMPTPIHELSRASATFTAPVPVASDTEWRSAQLAPSMNGPALTLQRYCAEAGLTPLCSEWWHFNDLETRTMVLERQGIGDFVIAACPSAAL